MEEGGDGGAGDGGVAVEKGYGGRVVGEDDFVVRVSC